jgi:hypothetical protein
MNSPRLPGIVTPIIFVFASLLAFAYACDDDEELLPESDSSPSAGLTLPATPSPAGVVPDDWPTYTDPNGLFTVRYPASWFQNGGSFNSHDPATWSSPSARPDAVEVEIDYYEAVGSGACGAALTVDPETGAATPTEGASPTTLGGLPAWEKTRLPDDSVIEGNLTRIHGISVIYQGYCFNIAAYFTQQEPDVDTFLLIVDTFRFLL